MKDKRELLELAARAAGYQVRWDEEAECMLLIDKLGTVPWRPDLEDKDGVALKEKLHMRITWSGGLVTASIPPHRGSTENIWDHGGCCATAARTAVLKEAAFVARLFNEQAARRLASTRAAAEVARNMK